MIMSWALLDRGVDATVDDSCDNANMHYAMIAGCWDSEDFFAHFCKYFFF